MPTGELCLLHQPRTNRTRTQHRGEVDRTDLVGSGSKWCKFTTSLVHGSRTGQARRPAGCLPAEMAGEPDHVDVHEPGLAVDVVERGRLRPRGSIDAEAADPFYV